LIWNGKLLGEMLEWLQRLAAQQRQTDICSCM